MIKSENINHLLLVLLEESQVCDLSWVTKIQAKRFGNSGKQSFIFVSRRLLDSRDEL